MTGDFLLGSLAGFSYFIESVIGFGGGVIFLGLAGFAFDFKLLLSIAIYTSCASSLTILSQARRHFSFHHYRRVFLLTLPGVVIGTWLLDVLAGPVLIHIFAVLLIAYAAKEILRPKLVVPPVLRMFFIVLLGGLAQGVFTTGGPFILMGYRQHFRDRTEMKVTMAGYFLTCNILRAMQLSATGKSADIYAQTLHYWWLPGPIIAAVMLGHVLHLKLPEAAFQKVVLYGLLLIGGLLLLR